MDALSDKKVGRHMGKAYVFVKKINLGLKKTARPDILGKSGGFNDLFEPCLRPLKQPAF